jgi:transposase-like protein
MRYSQGFKRSTVRKLLQPNPPTIQELSEDTGVSQQTLYNWLHQLKEDVEVSDYKRTPEEWSLLEKQEALLTVAGLSPEEEGEWLRRNGLHSAHLTIWKKEIHDVLKGVSAPASKQDLQKAKEQIKALEKDLKRKDKALAEVTALLALKKKLEILFHDEDV